MASTRIPIAWLLVFIIVGILAFFGYHILNASSSATLEVFPPYGSGRNDIATKYDDGGVQPELDQGEYDTTAAAPVMEQTHVHSMPRVAGQSEKDLRTPEPLQRSPPLTHYNAPEANDLMHPTVHMSSEFGSNLRHPEQMIETHPGIGTMQQHVDAGIASEYSSPGGHNAVGYSTEMIQNGGEWMGPGIHAFDTSESGVAYSML